MPELRASSVLSVSSEEGGWAAEELVGGRVGRGWRAAAGAKQATVELGLERASALGSVEIGNAGSAFVEVLVGRSADEAAGWQALVPATSLMAPLEARNGTNLSKVRLFGPKALAAAVARQKWDRVRLVCSQPFSKTRPFGIAFVRFFDDAQSSSNRLLPAATTTPTPTTPNPPADKPTPSTPTPQTDKPTLSNSTTLNNSFECKDAKGTLLGTFHLRDSDEDDEPDDHSLFAQRKKLNTSLSPTQPRSQTQQLPQQTQSFSQTQVLSQTLPMDEAETQPVSSTSVTSRQSTLSEEKKLKRDSASTTRGPKEEIKATTSRAEGKPSSPAPAKKAKREPAKAERAAAASPKPRGETKTPKPPAAEAKAEKKVKVKKPSERPFSRLFSGVVFAISGIANPERAEIREAGLEMGAAYRPDWTADATHLVCSVVGTPKYDLVQREGRGRIVSKRWLLDAYRQRRRRPWRRYALLPSLRDQPDSEDELLAQPEPF